MTTWDEVERLLSDNLKVHTVADNYLTLEVPCTRGRLQYVRVTQVEMGRSNWISFFSPICKTSEADADEILRAASKSIFGVWLAENFYGLAFAMPMDDLSLLEILDPLRAIVDDADDLELGLTGRDKY